MTIAPHDKNAQRPYIGTLRISFSKNDLARRTQDGIDERSGGLFGLFFGCAFLNATDTFNRIFLRDKSTDATYGLLNGGELIKNLATAAVLFNHALDAAHLSFDAAEAFQNVGACRLVIGLP